MTIAFDAKRAFHNSRGLGNYSRDLLRLAATYADDNRYLLCNPRQGAVRTMGADITGKMEELTPHGLWRLSPSAWRTWGCTEDVIHAGADAYWGLSAELPLNVHRTKLKTIVTVHDAIFIRYPELYSPTYRWLFTKKVHYACRVADIIVAVSRQTADDCINLLGADEKKVRVLYQGCSNIFRTKHSNTEIEATLKNYNIPANYILYVGAIEERKNIRNLILALRDLPDCPPLVIAGGRSRYAEEMKQLASELHLPVFFRHDIPFAEFPQLYQGATSFAYVSLFEGFGIPILESLCSGTPVVTSIGSCFSETGGNAALYADPTNPHDIADKLRQTLTDSLLRQQMREAGYKHAELFTDQHIGQEIKTLLNDIKI